MFDFFKSKPAAAPAAAVVDTRPKRSMMRQIAQGVQRMFKAGESDRLTMQWGTTPIPADVVIQRWQRTLVARSREQVANNDHAKAFIRMCRQNIVGPNGIQLQAQVKDGKGKLNKDINDAIELSFMRWTDRANCDVTGEESWRSIQTSCTAGAGSDGEFMVRLVYGNDAGPWGFAVQMIDPVRCPSDYDVQRPNSGNNNFIRAGIEYTVYGRPVAYHLTTTTSEDAEYSAGGRHYVRVPAADMVHGYKKDMIGQKRGLPWLATALFRLRNLNGYEDAAIINARIGASKMAFMKFEPGFGPEYDEDNPPEIDIEPGTMGILPEGADVVPWAPVSPAADLGVMLKHMLRGVATGLGVPYNELAGDLEGVNFSSIRQGTLDARENWKEQQEWLIEALIKPVFAAWLAYSMLAGKIANAKGKPIKVQALDLQTDISWQPRRWAWIDPNADVKAAVASKNNFLSSPGQHIREAGRDPQTVWIETARDMRAQVDAMVAEGFTPDEALELVKLGMGMMPKPPAPEVKPKATNE